MILLKNCLALSFWILKAFLLFLTCCSSPSGASHYISNATISGVGAGIDHGSAPACKFTTNYFTTQNVMFRMCMGHSDRDMKNGMTIIKLVESRGYLPTCRVMQLLLWMYAESGSTGNHGSLDSNHHGYIMKDAFIDIGANIGSCSVHMAALGFPVIAIEPVREHVDTILGSIALNPSFHLEVIHAGISHVERQFRVKYFGHGNRNWGATALVEATGNETAETELPMRTTDQIIGHRRVALVKIDCEGCELEALLGARRTLKRIPMIKMELVQQEYTAGNVTMSPSAVIEYLNKAGFDVFIDYWNEQELYFGKHGSVLMEIDQIFGSSKFNIGPDTKLMHDSARRILASTLDATMHHRNFLKKYTDIIAIERSLAMKMRRYWGIPIPTNTTA